MSEKDNLERYIHENAHDGSNINPPSDGNPNPPISPQKGDQSYTNVDLNTLPMGSYYKDGTKIKIRAASVGEIQNYAVVDDKNFIDITEKMNQMLSSCVRVQFIDGTIGSYKDIKDGDRMYLIFQIRELTFQQGPALSKKVECESCNNEFSIIYRTTKNQQYPKTIFSNSRSENLEKYFDNRQKCYVFKIPNKNSTTVEYKLAPPTIGVQECFFTDIRSKVEETAKKNPNIAQMKILQFLLWDRNYISPDGIKEKEDEIKNTYDMNTFQILNQAVNILSKNSGIKDLQQNCPICGSEVHSEMTFPNGASSIFVVSDFFEEFNR